MSITKREFGTLADGKKVTLFHLETASGAYAELLDYGTLLVKLVVPAKDGKLTDVVLGYDTLDAYVADTASIGACVGRNGNRIAKAAFLIHGKEYHLEPNENDNNLHSAPDFYSKKMWEAAEVSDTENRITFHRISPDGESGFPGNFDISVTYELTEEQELRITYHGVCDQATVANMTNHSYFNLSGEGSGTVLDQYLQILAETFTPVKDSHSIPTGVYQSVEGTPMDFRTPKQIGQDINADFAQLAYTGGYDHNYVTDHYEKGVTRLIAHAWSEKTGIRMEVTSDAPCVQLYAGNFLTGLPGKNGHCYEKRSGFCLETQVEPNAVNEAGFHSPVIEKGEVYHTVTGYRFYIS